MNTIKERLKFICNKLRLSESNLAIRCGLSASTLSKASRVNSIGIKASQKLSETFNINFDWIMHGHGEPFDEKPTEIVTINHQNITNNNNIKINHVNTSVKQRIEFICSKFGLSETQIANKAQIAQSSISASSKNNKISTKIAFKIADALGLEIEWLISGKGNPFKKNIEMIKKDIPSDIANPKIIKMFLALTKYDSNSISNVIIDEGTGFIGNALYVINVMGIPQLYFIRADVLGTITLITPENEQNITKEEFDKLDILGVVRHISKDF